MPSFKVQETNHEEAKTAYENLYQANPYPNIEDLLPKYNSMSQLNQQSNDCYVHCPLPQMPMPKYSKQACSDVKIVQPASDTNVRIKEIQPIFPIQQVIQPVVQPVNQPVIQEKKIAQPIKPQEEIQPNYQIPVKEKIKKEDRMSSSEYSKKFKPYSLGDYKDIKPQKYYALGGLGANVGGNEWQVKKEKVQRMTEYAKCSKLMNKEQILANPARPPLHEKPKKTEQVEALKKKQRMLEYAKNVPKPKVITPSKPQAAAQEDDFDKKVPTSLSELEKLEMQHNKYMDEVEKLKGVLN